jgi:hypothetical protein
MDDVGDLNEVAEEVRGRNSRLVMSEIRALLKDAEKKRELTPEFCIGLIHGLIHDWERYR